MGPDQDRTRDPWICSQTRICSLSLSNINNLMYNSELKILNITLKIALYEMVERLKITFNCEQDDFLEILSGKLH